jgi:hypothetical protein
MRLLCFSATPARMHRAARVFVMLIAAAACSEHAAAPQHARPASRLGQWIWTRADLTPFVAAHATHRALEAAVFIGTVQCDARTHTVSARAALSVAVVNDAPVSAVIRFEDGFDRCRDANGSSRRFNASLDSAVGVLRARVGKSVIREVQLDHDVPTRALAVWAQSVAILRASSLRGDAVWVTSLVAHLRAPEYGALFHAVIDGHVLQVFDTGEEATPEHVAEALQLVARAGVPFRVGVGAFERQTRDGPTDHRAWILALTRFATVDGYRGAWVFPAGKAWVSLLPEPV